MLAQCNIACNRLFMAYSVQRWELKSGFGFPVKHWERLDFLAKHGVFIPL